MDGVDYVSVLLIPAITLLVWIPLEAVDIPPGMPVPLVVVKVLVVDV